MANNEGWHERTIRVRVEPDTTGLNPDDYWVHLPDDPMGFCMNRKRLDAATVQPDHVADVSKKVEAVNTTPTHTFNSNTEDAIDAAAHEAGMASGPGMGWDELKKEMGLGETVQQWVRSPRVKDAQSYHMGRLAGLKEALALVDDPFETDFGTEITAPGLGKLNALIEAAEKGMGGGGC